MQEFHEGQLLIGGMALTHLEGQLAQEQHADESDEWLLSGSFHVNPQDEPHLQTGRPYRLLLDDGRAGQVVVETIETGDRDRVAQFRPGDHKPR